jgi:sulfite oxidase
MQALRGRSLLLKAPRFGLLPPSSCALPCTHLAAAATSSRSQQQWCGKEPWRGSSHFWSTATTASAAVAAACLTTFTGVSVAQASAAEPQPSAPGPARRSDGSAWPVYRRAEVATHTGAASGGVWVTYRDGVYDVTDFLANHPGGAEKLLLAAGKAVDAFWQLYPQHLNTPTAVAALAARRVGTLHADDVAVEQAALSPDDPYAKDPRLHPALKLHARTPATAEPPLELLVHSYITPGDLWFVRSHHPVPPCALPGADASAHRLTLLGPSGAQLLSLSVAELRSRFPAVSVTSTLQCGGNRRSDMNGVRSTAGIAWGQGAISTATWTGARLSDVIAAAGDVAGDIAHVVFTGADGMTASIPARKACDPAGDVVLAYAMNGQPIPPHHGAPLRAVVPGIVGVRSVKWLTGIHLSSEEAHGPWQRGMAYKAFPPGQTSISAHEDVAQLPSVQEQPVNSAIASPAHGSTISVADGVISLKGYAFSGGGRRIIRVDVSIDGGSTWHSAVVDPLAGGNQPSGRAWAWSLWEAHIAVDGSAYKPGDAVVCVCKATDESMNGQPEGVAPVWNLRGLNCNAWHKVTVTVAAHNDAEESSL